VEERWQGLAVKEGAQARFATSNGF